MAVLRDLAEITHWVSVVKITPEAAEDPTVSPDERARGVAMAEALPMRVLTRLWQMLLTALDEVANAPNAMMAAEMAIIRLTHVADLPSPEELVSKLHATPVPPSGTGQSAGGGTVGHSPGPRAAGTDAPGRPVASPQRPPASSQGTVTAIAPQVGDALARFPTFEHVVELIRANRDVKLLVEVETCLRLAQYQPGRIEFAPTDNAPKDLAQRLGHRLQSWTGNRWAVSVVSTCDAKTIAEVRDASEIALQKEAKDHPLMQAVLARFPNARITAIRTPEQIAAEAITEALPEVEDEWDPFEDS
jgi:DNA polymerase-3 subunit gamma/tau